MRNVNRFQFIAGQAALPVAVGALALLLAGCSAFESVLPSDKIDYKSGAQKTQPLEVPPDLTQLARDNRYQPQGGAVSANSFQVAPPASVSAAQNVAPQQLGAMHIERDGSTRWLVTPLTPEQLWPQLRTFWQQRGFNLLVDSPEAGVMETDWAENRANIKQDFIRNSIGKVLDSLYDTGLRDKYRTRVERTAQGTEVTISHRGMEEVTQGTTKESFIWQPRPADPGLEAEMLSRLMVALGAKEQEARAAVAAATPASGAVPAAAGAPAHARLLSGQPTPSLQVDEPFDRAWRRVGLALDRTGFTVEDRDRANGVYYVRYADPKMAGQDEPGFFSKLFGGSKETGKPARYRIEVKRGGTENTTVSVLNSQGAPDNGEIAQRIVGLLVDDLK
jgi:outer membrane protein assembly factor BamC